MNLETKPFISTFSPSFVAVIQMKRQTPNATKDQSVIVIYQAAYNTSSQIFSGRYFPRFTLTVELSPIILKGIELKLLYVHWSW